MIGYSYASMEGLTVRQLEVFLAVAAHEHVTRAAGALCMSQPSVSHQLRTLERALGITLFERVGRGIRLTRDGRALVPPATAVLAARRALVDAATARRGLVAGDLVIAASSTVGIYRLPAWLGRFVERYRLVDISVRLTSTHDAVALLGSLDADCALVEGPESADGLDRLVVEDDEVVLVAAPTHPLASLDRLTARDLIAHRYLAQEAGSGTEALASELLRDAYRRGPILELNQVDAVRAAAVAGLGWAVISLAAVADALASGSLRRLPTNLTYERQFVALRRSGPPGPAAEAFWRHLIDVAASRTV